MRKITIKDGSEYADSYLCHAPDEFFDVCQSIDFDDDLVSLIECAMKDGDIENVVSEIRRSIHYKFKEKLNDDIYCYTDRL